MIPPVVQPGDEFQRVRMPNAAGVAGESLSVVSVSGNLVQLEWVVAGELIDTENETRVGRFELADGSLQFITQQGINPEIVDDVILASAMQAAIIAIVTANSGSGPTDGQAIIFQTSTGNLIWGAGGGGGSSTAGQPFGLLLALTKAA